MRTLNADRRNAPWVTNVRSYEKYRFQSRSSLPALGSQESIVVISFPCKQPHQLASARLGCLCGTMLSRKIRSNWFSPEWASRVSTCRPKQFHIWMNKCQCATYLWRWLHHFLWVVSDWRKRRRKKTKHQLWLLINRRHSVTQWLPAATVSDLEQNCNDLMDLYCSGWQWNWPLKCLLLCTCMWWTCLFVSCSHESRPQASKSGEGRSGESDAATVHNTGEQRGATARIHTQLWPASKGNIGWSLIVIDC